MAAFNNAWATYQNHNTPDKGESREETAHRIAWAAVKRRYRKDPNTGRWEEKTVEIQD